jgi:mRNA interferase MazF
LRKSPLSQAYLIFLLLRGAIHYCALGENIGNEQNKERPVIIVSSDTINSTSGNVLVAPLTETLKKKRKNGELVLTKDGKPVPKYSSHLFLFKDKYGFLADNSAIMTEEIKSVSKARLKNHRGTVTDPLDIQEERRTSLLLRGSSLWFT